MDVRVHVRKGQVDDEIRDLAATKVVHAARILNEDGSSADVEFTERTNPRLADGRYRVEITTVLKGQTVRVEADAPDERSALDLAVDKLENRLRRLKERLVQRYRGRGGATTNGGVPPVDLEPSIVGQEDTPADEGPAVVRTKRFELRPMSVEEASLQMEMLGHDFFFFLDADSGRHCVLYHRKDGAYGLIESA